MAAQDQSRLSAWYNWISAIGAFLALAGLAAGVFVFILDATVRNPPAYLGLLYLPALGAIVLGTVMVPLGFVLATRRIAKGLGTRLPITLTIDLTIKRHRYVLAGLSVGGVVSALVLATGGFEVYHALETDAFCGQTCHSVMAPEDAAHKTSNHAQVRCVECHVGSGVEHYVAAKLNGLHQVAALITGTVQRPIPTPVAQMRPAREICEACHNATRFVGFKEKVFHYYVSGDKSDEHKMRMLIKIGGGGGDSESLFIKGAGIHYHMLSANKIEFIARDRKRQEIGWLKATRPDGTSTVYTHKDFTLTDEQKKATPRTMDCLDCHNRPAHQFRSPVDAVDGALASGKLSRKIPAIKVQAVKALDGKYASTDEAMKGISDRITGFLKDEHPDVLEKQGDLVKQTVATLQTIYRGNFFPEMKAKWSAYPDNSSHRDWPGCFRCHTPNMVSDKGTSPVTNCSTCHLILAQDAGVDKVANVNFAKGKPFDHPGYGDTISEYSKCIDCHTGGADLY